MSKIKNGGLDYSMAKCKALTGSAVKGLNPNFLNVSSSIAIYPLLRFISWNLITRCLAVTGGGIGESGRLSQLTGCTIIPWLGLHVK